MAGHSALIHDMGLSLARQITKPFEDSIKSTNGINRLLNGLKDHSAPRTNQFEIDATCRGLIEKFEVFDREDLAAALRTRLDKVTVRSNKWLPEILSLFLQLSNRPVERTKLEDVEKLITHEEDQLDISWKEIWSELPSDQSLWADVERGYHSSGDESPDEPDSDHTASTLATTIHEDEELRTAHHTQQADFDGLQQFRSSQLRTDPDAAPRSVTEISLIREALSMLQGLPTRFFAIDDAKQQIVLDPGWTISTASMAVTNQIMKDLADVGSSLYRLRCWISTSQAVVHIQSCQAAVRNHLKQFSLDIAIVENRFLNLQTSTTTISVLNVKAAIEDLARPLIALSAVLQKAVARSSTSPFALLDELYDGVCTAQMSGDDAVYTTVRDVLLATLVMYLRPASAWISYGTLIDYDSTFFVTEDEGSQQLGRLWRHRFSLRRTLEAHLTAPSFIRPFANRIFALGKSQALLRALGEHEVNEVTQTILLTEFAVALEPMQHSHALTPFSQVLDNTLTLWISNTSSDCNSLLRSKMLGQDGILQTQIDLDYAFCSSNGVAFQAFADTLFWRMDHDRENWADLFILTELAQSTLGSNKREGSESSLKIRLSHDAMWKQKNSQKYSSLQLSDLMLEYTFPEMMQNITHSTTATCHSKILSFLLQLYHVKHRLRSTTLNTRTNDTEQYNFPKQVYSLLRLRHRLLWLVAALHEHITRTANVLGSAVRRDLQNAEDIDAMVRIWSDYTDRLEFDLLITDHLQPIRHVIMSILELGEKFSEKWQAAMRIGAESQTTGPRHVERENRGERQGIAVREFDTLLSSLINRLQAVCRAGGSAPLEALSQHLAWRD